MFSNNSKNYFFTIFIKDDLQTMQDYATVDFPFIKEEAESEFEDASESDLELDEHDPEGTSFVVSDVSMLWSGIERVTDCFHCRATTSSISSRRRRRLISTVPISIPLQRIVLNQSQLKKTERDTNVPFATKHLNICIY